MLSCRAVIGRCGSLLPRRFNTSESRGVRADLTAGVGRRLAVRSAGREGPLGAPLEQSTAERPMPTWGHSAYVFRPQLAGVPQKPEPKNAGVSSEETRRPGPGPAGRVGGRGRRAGQNNASDVLFSLALCRSALFSLNERCARSPHGKSLGDSQPVPEGTRVGVN